MDSPKVGEWWPRGRYNGKRIVGVSVKFGINVSDWIWLPWISWKYSGAIHWLCFRTWTEWVFE